METYVDGFLIPVPKANIDAYRDMAELACTVWLEHGALQYCEYVGDDLHGGQTGGFPLAAQASEDELVVFAWIVYPSREARDRINAAVMADPRLAHTMEPGSPMPFDVKRMAWGGFKPLVVRDAS